MIGRAIGFMVRGASARLGAAERDAERADVRELQLRMANIRAMRPFLGTEDLRRADLLLMRLSHLLAGPTVAVQELRLRMAKVQAMRHLLDEDGLRESNKLLSRLTQALAKQAEP